MTKFKSAFWLVFVSLIACASAAEVEWEFLVADQNNKVYLDPDSITQEGPFIKAWTLIDMLNGLGLKLYGIFYTAKSIKSLDMYSCNEGKRATLREISFTELHGDGKILHDVTYTKESKAIWTHWPTDTFFYKQIKAICSRVDSTGK